MWNECRSKVNVQAGLGPVSGFIHEPRSGTSDVQARQMADVPVKIKPLEFTTRGALWLTWYFDLDPWSSSPSRRLSTSQGRGTIGRLLLGYVPQSQQWVRGIHWECGIIYNNVHFCFTHMHWCVLALYTQYFPELRDCPVARGSSNRIF